MLENQNVGFGFSVDSGGDASIFATNQLPDVFGIVKAKLQQAASSPDLFFQVFGDKANTAEIQAVRSQWSVGDFSQLPSIQILSAANANGAFGAYANSNQTIYLSDALFQSGAAPTNSILEAAGVLIEETFHWLDDLVGTDTQGDEGELGKMLVFGAPMSNAELTRIRQDDDRGFISVNGQTIAVEMDNTLALANNLGTVSGNITRTGFVGSSDTNDYYRFSVSNSSNFTLALNGLSADADVQLLNSSGVVLQSSAAGGSSPESISRLLAAGDYYVRVHQFSGDTNYNLSLTALIPDLAGNTLATARNIGALSGTRTFADAVGSSDTNDYYRFSVSNSSNFTLALNGLSADADVQLLNSSGVVLQSSAAGGSSPESISRLLAAGDYYVRVHQFSGDTNYNLSLTALIPDLAGNTLATARNIGALSGTRTFADAVGSSDTNDYYRFSVSNSSNFTLALNGLSADADVQLLNSSGVLIQGSYLEGSLPESITRTLNAGTYYIRVFPYSGDTNYNLSLSATPIPIVIPPGGGDGAPNTLATARNVGTLSTTQTFNDFVGSTDTNDYYKFTVAQSGNFTLALSGLTADADVELLNSTGGLIQRAAAGGLSSETISRLLNVGTYYVRVYPYAGNTNYQLTLGVAPASAGGFNSTYGYGLVNAAAAVARAIGQQTPFADVADLGGNNWGNDLVNAPEVWARGNRGQGIVVAVLDTGVDYNHVDLNDNIWINTGEIAGNGVDDDRNGYIDDVRGWDFIGRDNNPMDGGYHGTHVAGTIAAENNGMGATGVASSARIMAVRVLGPNGGTSADVASGIRYAASNGANVINLSLGGSFDSGIASAIQFASSRGSIVVMASGNDGASQPGNPASIATQFGIAVGAVDINRNNASFSNRAGSNSAMQYVVAPGVNIYSTVPGNTYRLLDGTSMATPHVAGVVALMLAANRSLTPDQVRNIITTTASGYSSQSAAVAGIGITSTTNTNLLNSLSYSSISRTVATARPLMTSTDLFGNENWNYDLVNEPDWVLGII